MHTDINDESLGIRLHEVNRQRAVDRAIERLRHGLRADWHYLTGDDHTNLRWILGEVWATAGRAQWEQLAFSRLDLEAVRRLVSLGDRLRRHGTSKMSSLDAASGIIAAASVANSPAASLAY